MLPKEGPSCFTQSTLSGAVEELDWVLVTKCRKLLSKLDGLGLGRPRVVESEGDSCFPKDCFNISDKEVEDVEDTTGVLPICFITPAPPPPYISSGDVEG